MKLQDINKMSLQNNEELKNKIEVKDNYLQ